MHFAKTPEEEGDVVRKSILDILLMYTCYRFSVCEREGEWVW